MNFRLLLPLLPLLAASSYGVAVPAPTPAPEEPAITEEAAPPALRLPPERDETRRAKALEEQLKQVDRATEITWLGEGDERFLGLYRADSSGSPFGNLLVLHDNLQHPDWPGIVRGLREDLSRHGWNTLSIAMPDYRPLPDLPPLPAPEPPPAENEAAPAKDEKAKPPAPGKAANDTQPPSEPPAESDPAAEQPAQDIYESVEYKPEQVPDVVDSRIRLGMEFLREKDPSPVVIVTIGLSAGFAAKKTQTLLIRDVAGLVLIDPVQPEGADFNTDLDALDLRIPVLDIAPQFNPRTPPGLRLANARRARHQSYEQSIVEGAQRGITGYENQVVRIERGWGERHFKPR